MKSLFPPLFVGRTQSCHAIAKFPTHDLNHRKLPKGISPLVIKDAMDMSDSPELVNRWFKSLGRGRISVYHFLALDLRYSPKYKFPILSMQIDSGLPFRF